MAFFIDLAPFAILLTLPFFISSRHFGGATVSIEGLDLAGFSQLPSLRS